MTQSVIEKCRIIEVERHRNPAGTIAVAENNNALPFAIKRVFYIYDIPSDTRRGGHSHHKGEQLVIAASGCFDVVVSDGKNSKRFTLNRPYRALYLPAGLWITLEGFSSGCVCLTLCSNRYDDSDYIRDFDTFLKNQSR